MAKRRCKNGRRKDGKCRKTTARRTSTKGSRLYTDVSKFVRATKRKSCASPERAARTARAISYLKHSAAVEAGDGLNKSTARTRISGLRRAARLVMTTVRDCERQSARAAKKASRKGGGARASTGTAITRWGN